MSPIGLALATAGIRTVPAFLSAMARNTRIPAKKRPDKSHRRSLYKKTQTPSLGAPTYKHCIGRTFMGEFLTESFTFLGVQFQNWMPIVLGLFAIYICLSLESRLEVNSI